MRYLDLVGELEPCEDVSARDEQELRTAWSVALRDEGVEVRHRPGDAGPGHPDVIVSPRGGVATTKRRTR